MTTGMGSLATPRPWTVYPREDTGPVLGRRQHTVIAAFSGKDSRGLFTSLGLGGAGRIADANVDAALIVEAVNAYDRLRAIEAAAREWLEADRAYVEADFGADEEEQAVAHVAKDVLRAALDIET